MGTGLSRSHARSKFMKNSSWFARNRRILLAIGIPVLLVLWWEFRPEKLWVNQRVNEPAPFVASGEPQPLFTGRLESKAHPTTGRATIYKGPEGKQYLRLTDFSTSNGPDVHVVLASAKDRNVMQEIVTGPLDNVELGTLRGNQGDQNYDLPGSVDLRKYNAVVIYCERFHAVFGVASLEAF